MTEDSKDIKRALSQTLTDDQIDSQRLHELAETITDTEAETLREENIEAILLETLPDEKSDTVDDPDEEHQALNERTFFHKSEAEDQLNKNIIGRYQINAALTSDAIGQWFGLKDNNTEREINVKFLKPSQSEDETAFNKFVNEARTLAQLSHPGIPTVHEIDLTEGGLIYYTCSQFSGQTLQQLLEEAEASDARIPPPIRTIDDRVDLFKRVCEAVAYAHQHGIIHQDIKPDHILVDDQSAILVTGWLHAINKDSPDPHVAGTPLYMSPEQARQETATHLSDIHCLGACFLYLLTLRPPLQTEPITEFWENKRKGNYQEPSEQESALVPSALLAITEKTMAADPERRYQSVTEIIEALDDYQQQQSARRQPLRSQHSTSTGFHSIVFFAFIALLLLAAIAIGIWQTTGPETEKQAQWHAVSLSSWQHGTLSDLETDWACRIHNDNNKTFIPLSQAGIFTLSQGKLALRSGAPMTDLRYKHILTDNLGVSWNQAAGPFSDIDCFIAGTNGQHAYRYHINTTDQSLSLSLFRADVLIDRVRLQTGPDKDGNLQLAVRKQQDLVTLSVNGKTVHRYRDPYPLAGMAHSQLGFTLYPDSDMHISDVAIKRTLMPPRQPETAIADSRYAAQNYETAIKLYQDLTTLVQSEDTAGRALYRIARCYSKLRNHQSACESYRRFIQEHSQHVLMPYAVLHYIIALGQTGQWQICEDTLNTLGTHLQPDGLHNYALNELRRLTNNETLRPSPSLSSLRKYIKSLSP